jgi:hypothetical protein
MKTKNYRYRLRLLLKIVRLTVSLGEGAVPFTKMVRSLKIAVMLYPTFDIISDLEVATPGCK